jgi:DNA-binding CsgD family transcriptional regulator
MLALSKGLRGAPRDEVVAQATYALEGGRLMGERAAGAWASPQALTALVAVDEHELALRACETLAEQSRLSGSFMGTSGNLGFRGWIFAKRGDLAAAEAELRIAWDLVNQAGMPLLITSAMYFLVDAVLERPSLDDVAELVHGLGLEPAFLASWGGAMLFEVRGRLRLMQGDRRGAIEDLREVTEVARALGVSPTFSPCRSALALALGPEDRAEADELVAEELELARASGVSRPEGVALRAAGLLTGGEEGIALLRSSLSALEQSEAALERARTLVELGSALRRAGQRAEARDPLTGGMDLAHHCGAPRLVERARDELRATGARPRRVVRIGVDSLTASELRVARLAAAGRTNPEIAQELYVSVKTVETHLSRAYAKLGLAGQGARSGLAEHL